MVSIDDILKQAGNVDRLMSLVEGNGAKDEGPELEKLLRARNIHEQEADIDVVDFLNEQFDSVESLSNVDKILGDLDKSMHAVDDKLREAVREQAYAAENARAQLAVINENSGSIITTIRNVK
jgi:hypothetical protein